MQNGQTLKKLLININDVLILYYTNKNYNIYKNTIQIIQQKWQFHFEHFKSQQDQKTLKVNDICCKKKLTLICP